MHKLAYIQTLLFRKAVHLMDSGSRSVSYMLDAELQKLIKLSIHRRRAKTLLICGISVV